MAEDFNFRIEIDSDNFSKDFNDFVKSFKNGKKSNGKLFAMGRFCPCCFSDGPFIKKYENKINCKCGWKGTIFELITSQEIKNIKRTSLIDKILD